MAFSRRSKTLSTLYGQLAKLQVEIELLDIAVENRDQLMLMSLLDIDMDRMVPNGVAMLGVSYDTVRSIITELEARAALLAREIAEMERPTPSSRDEQDRREMSVPSV